MKTLKIETGPTYPIFYVFVEGCAGTYVSYSTVNVLILDDKQIKSSSHMACAEQFIVTQFIIQA